MVTASPNSSLIDFCIMLPDVDIRRVLLLIIANLLTQMPDASVNQEFEPEKNRLFTRLMKEQCWKKVLVFDGRIFIDTCMINRQKRFLGEIRRDGEWILLGMLFPTN